MSTRATYNINGHSFYIHHDGHPAGAAEYFLEALYFASERKKAGGKYAPNASFADDFIRANPRAELVHEDASATDIEYRYTVRGDSPNPGSLKLTAEHIGRSGTVFDGTVDDFISTHQRARS